MVMKKILKICRRFSELFLPRSFSRKLLGFYGLIKSPTKSYSQKGEDILIDAFFERRSKGYYLDIGCYHPKWISNTHILHQRGWHGTAIDIDQYKLELFKSLRKNSVNIMNKAIVGRPTKESSVATVYRFRNRLGWSDIDTLDKKLADYKAKNGWGEYEIEEVSVLYINDLLATLPHVNFLNIDVEGLDDEIIKAIDLDKYKIDLILFEDNANFGGSKSIKDKLKKNGYEHLFTSGGSVCFYLSSNTGSDL